MNKLATVALLARNLPKPGGRHEWALPVAGFLLRHLDEPTVQEVCKVVWRDGDAPDRAVEKIEAVVRDTAEKLRAGRPTTGERNLEKKSPGLPCAIAEVWGWTIEGAKGDKPTDDELADAWLEEHPDTWFCRGNWWKYDPDAGLYNVVSDNVLRRTFWDVLKEAKPDGIRPSRNLVSSVLDAAIGARELPDDALDADPDLLVVGNGTLRLSTRDVLPFSPEHFATTGVPFDYDEDADCPKFKELLDRIDGCGLRYAEKRAEETGEKIDPVGPLVSQMLAEFVGLALTPEQKYERMLWLVGPPGSGKSTFIEAIEAVFGARTGTVGVKDFSGRFGLARIVGKTLLTGTEQPSVFLEQTDTLTALVSGETVSLEQKFRNEFDYKPVGKVMWAMNAPPKVASPQDGIFRRLLIVPFEVLVGKDPSFKDALRGEASGILNWALDGLDRLTARGDFAVPEPVRLRVAEYHGETNIEGRFVEEWCELDSNSVVLSTKLYKAYQRWCELNGHKAKTSTRFYGIVRERFEQKRKKGYPHFYGLDLNDTGENVLRWENNPGIRAALDVDPPDVTPG